MLETLDLDIWGSNCLIPNFSSNVYMNFTVDSFHFTISIDIQYSTFDSSSIPRV